MADSLLPLNNGLQMDVTAFKQPGLLSASEVVNPMNKIAVVGVMPAQ